MLEMGVTEGRYAREMGVTEGDMLERWESQRGVC